MKHKMHIQFATHIYQASALKPTSKLTQALIHDVERIFERDRKGHLWSQKAYNNGYTSYGSLDQLHLMSDSFRNLSKIIDKHVARFIKELKFEASFNQFFLSRLWINIMPQNCYHAWHIHPLSVISGTFYLQLPKSKSPIRFEDPRLHSFMNRPVVKSAHGTDSNFFVLQPAEGDLILFESWLKHEVPMHHGKEPRISLSFNYDWRPE
jgi:uncharacterized protein (TIGR02466 family)